MSSEAETQQAPQPAADEEGPSSPAAAASAGDKKVIGKGTGNELLARIANGLWGPALDRWNACERCSIGPICCLV